MKRDAKPQPVPNARKPGERKPPAHVKLKPETKKDAGAGGAPSPVGENDLA